MKPDQSKKSFTARLKSDGRKLADLTAGEAVAAMLAFYAEDRAEGCELDDDGDMLLFQWGLHDFGKAESFQLDITRQFILPDEDEPYQLSLTLHFEPSPALRKLKDGDKWCDSPGKLAAFRKFIEGSASYRAVEKLKPEKVMLGFGGC